MEQVRDLPGGGVDFAFELAGSIRALEIAYLVTRCGGTTVTAGLSPPDRRMPLPAVSLVAEERTLKGSYIGSCVPARDIPRFIALYQQGKLPVDRLMSARIARRDQRGLRPAAGRQGDPPGGDASHEPDAKTWADGWRQAIAEPCQPDVAWAGKTQRPRHKKPKRGSMNSSARRLCDAWRTSIEKWTEFAKEGLNRARCRPKRCARCSRLPPGASRRL